MADLFSITAPLMIRNPQGEEQARMALSILICIGISASPRKPFTWLKGH